MSNLNRGPKNILVNTLTNKQFGYYTNAAGTRILADKQNGFAIPYESTFGAPTVVCGYGQEENLETILLNMYAPYPSDSVNWISQLNITKVPRKNDDVRSHMEISKLYEGIVPSLGIASGVEVADDDKLTALKQIVQVINHDEHRFVNAGMVWVITDEDSDDASGVTITLENGFTKTIASVANNTSLAAAINADTDLNPYIKAYMPTVTNTSATDIYCIIENIVPCYFSVEDGTDTNVEKFYLKLEQIEENVALTYSGGTTETMWERVDYFRYTLDAAACVDAADDADVTVTVNGTDTAINITVNTNDSTKALDLANQFSTAGVVTIPANCYPAALNTAGIVTMLIIGAETFDVANTANTDLWDIEEVELKHKWALLNAKDMSAIFPNLPGNEFQVVDLPDPNSRYFMLEIKWKYEGDDNVVFDGSNARRGHVCYYIKESCLPANILTDNTKNYWVDGNNMMTDSTVGANIHFAELINKWTNAATITDAILAG
jgi:capsular polysaccharide biosynthesis protein